METGKGYADGMDEDTDKNPEVDMYPLKAAVAMLSEHFDAVQVFASKRTKDGKTTLGLHSGAGNYYARKGQVMDWLEAEE